AAFPAAPSAIAASAATATALGVAIAPSAIQPPASYPTAATARLGARTRRSRPPTDELPVQRLVAGHHALGRERERVRRGRGPQPGVQGGIAQHRDGPLG